MDKKIRHRIYNQIAMRYRRADPKNWKTIVLGDMTFEQALRKAIAEQERREQLGIERREIKSPLGIEGITDLEQWKKDRIAERQQREQHQPQDAYSGLGPLLESAFGSSRKEQDRKELCDMINEITEERIARSMCPICKSSVCHCPESEEIEKVD